MKLMIIRHADPDYAIDSLTPRGWQEAELLADRLEHTSISEICVSPLGRARDTASCLLRRSGAAALECDWLREFPPQIRRPDRPERPSISWDWLPQDWTLDERFYRRDLWYTQETMVQGQVKQAYDQVTSGLDQLLASHGYVREGNCYRVERANMDTLALFCHFGVECVLLSHLLNVSPMTLWHGCCAAPASITTLVTEERRAGIASFRMGSFGDTAHLYVKGMEPSFSARFCECYANLEERHD